MRVVKIFQRRVQIQNIIQAHKGVDHIPHGVIGDGGEEFLLKTYYINPQEQIRTLAAMGFQNVRVFSEHTGEEITAHSALSQMKQDRWFYFLCTVNK